MEVGHNSDGKLKALTERINRLEDNRKEIGDDIKSVYAEAKSDGYDVKALKVVIRRQRADARKLAEHEAQVETYLAALGLS